MADQSIELMAHLMRRAGFGATRDELETYVEKGYEATVEELLNPGDPGLEPYDVVWRKHVSLYEMLTLPAASGTWMHRMITSRCPLEEKLTLFWPQPVRHRVRQGQQRDGAAQPVQHLQAQLSRQL